MSMQPSSDPSAGIFDHIAEEIESDAKISEQLNVKIGNSVLKPVLYGTNTKFFVTSIRSLREFLDEMEAEAKRQFDTNVDMAATERTRSYKERLPAFRNGDGTIVISVRTVLDPAFVSQIKQTLATSATKRGTLKYGSCPIPWCI